MTIDDGDIQQSEYPITLFKFPIKHYKDALLTTSEILISPWYCMGMLQNRTLGNEYVRSNYSTNVLI